MQKTVLEDSAQRITLTNVTKRYGKAPVLKNVTLNIDEPGIYCLLGRNGAGKTTLLKSIAGYQNITEGEIKGDGKPIATSTLSTGVSYIKNVAKHFNLPVRKLLQIASEVNPSYDYGFAAEMMERFELDENKKFNQLSLGMKPAVRTPFFFVFYDYTKLMYLGASKKDYSFGSLTAYGLIARLVSLVNTGIYFVIDPLNSTQPVINMMALYGWAANGIFIAFLQQAVFLLLTMIFLHVLLSMQPYWYGWLSNGVLEALYFMGLSVLKRKTL